MSKLIAHTKLFDVIEKDEYAPGFKPIAIQIPDCVIMVVRQNGWLLTTKQFRHGAGEVLTEFPSGRIEEGEDPTEAASRELHEETGYMVNPRAWKKLGEVYPNASFMTNKLHVYFVDLDKDDYLQLKPCTRPNEKLTTSWLSPSDLAFSPMQSLKTASSLSAFELYRRSC